MIAMALACAALVGCSKRGGGAGGGMMLPTGGTGGTTAAGVGGSTGSGGSMTGTGGVGGSTGSGGTMATGGMGGSAGVMSGSGGMSGAAGSMGASGMGSGGSMMTGSGGTGGGSLGGPLMYTGTFTMGMSIPVKNMCQSPIGGSMPGGNVSPALSWSGGPAETKSYAIVLYDVVYNMLHWVIWDIPPTVNELPEGLPSGYDVANPAGAHQVAAMGSDQHAYYGPCSAGTLAATYEYRLYALDKDKLDLTESSTGQQAQMAVEAAQLEMTVWSGKPAQ